jgi:Sulfotransferase family
VLPLPRLDLSYEALVADLEGEARRLIAFLGLDWEPACLDFHRVERAIKTASVWQVRQPLYSRSAGRWRNYEKHLGPLLEVLSAGSG